MGESGVRCFSAFHWQKPLHTHSPGTVGQNTVQPDGALKERIGPHHFFIQSHWQFLEIVFLRIHNFLLGQITDPFKTVCAFVSFLCKYHSYFKVLKVS